MRQDDHRNSSFGRSSQQRGDDDRNRNQFMSRNDEGGMAGGRAYNPYDRDDDYDQASWRRNEDRNRDRGGNFSTNAPGYPEGRGSSDDRGPFHFGQGGGSGDFRSSGAFGYSTSGGGYTSEGGGFTSRSRGGDYGGGRDSDDRGGFRSGGERDYSTGGRGDDRSWQHRGNDGQQGNSREFGGWSANRDRYEDRIGSYPGQHHEDDRSHREDRGWFGHSDEHDSSRRGEHRGMSGRDDDDDRRRWQNRR